MLAKASAQTLISNLGFENLGFENLELREVRSIKAFSKTGGDAHDRK
ncbi:MAG: hypothetical protein HC849_26215 [Oscillatoriales cyanobacterium RU_3_3]|nr:hypothetical protein [Oscillatoriales cyanobacterium RU_3_3]